MQDFNESGSSENEKKFEETNSANNETTVSEGETADKKVTEDISEKADKISETSKKAKNKKNEIDQVELLKQKDEEIEQLKNKILRLQADFLNYKSRVEKEKANTYSNAVSCVLADILPIVDNFERALEAEAPTKEVETYKAGMSMIENQLKIVLEKKGLKEIEAVGKKFDPNFHQSIAFDAESDKEEDTVTEVFQKGYMAKEKVIRPSVVKIAKKQ